MDSPRLQSGKLHEKPILPKALLRRPFAESQTPDIVTKVYEQVYLVNRQRYSPAIATRSPAPPTFSGAYLGPADATDASAYLVKETNPDDDVIDQLRARVKRTFSYVPGDQVSADRRVYSRPNMHGIVVNGFYAVSFDDGETSMLFKDRNTVLTAAAMSASTQLVTEPMPHAYFYFRDSGGNTCYVLADDTTGNIQTALTAALLAVSSIVVTSSGVGNLHITYTGTISVITPPANVTTSFTPGILDFNCQGSVTTPAMTYFKLGSAHGASVGNQAAFWCGNVLVGQGVIRGIPSTDTLAILASEVAADSNITHAQITPGGLLRVVNGSKDCRLRLTDRFYLPTVTTGISSPADIPATPVYTDPIAWLGRITATTLTSVSATAATDKLNKTAHGLSTGDCFFLIASGGGAAGLGANTQYYAIRVDADNWKAATSPDNAIAGTAIDITSDSSGGGLTILVPAPYAAIAASQVTSWMGPILQRRKEEIQMADAIEVRNLVA